MTDILLVGGITKKKSSKGIGNRIETLKPIIQSVKCVQFKSDLIEKIDQSFKL